jgi:hypothetical protein
VSEAALVGEAEVRVSPRADRDPLTSRVSVLPGWRGWLKWLRGVGGGGREGGEWRGTEGKGAGGRGGAAAGAAASIYYRDDRFFGNAGGLAGQAGGGVEANGRACVDVAAWTACVKLHSDMLKCWSLSTSSLSLALTHTHARTHARTITRARALSLSFSHSCRTASTTLHTAVV